MNGENWWVATVRSIILSLVRTPMHWTGHYFEFLLNLISLNHNLPTLIFNIIHGKVILPQRDSETFISTIGHLDNRMELYKRESLATNHDSDIDCFGYEISNVQLKLESRALMDLCIMASNLAYENEHVVRNVVVHHFKMHFVDFYDRWNDFQKASSTQVFIMCDKSRNANLILISFRGTEPFDADDWSTDFDYSWYEIPKLGKVHLGFLEALGLGNRHDPTTFRDNLNNVDVRTNMLKISAYCNVKLKLKCLLEKHKNAKFVMTGHSLRGALAILFIMVLLVHNENETMRRLMGIYTFGQPRVGDKNLRMYMDAHLNRPIPKYYRVVYCNDLVPRLPYDNKIFLYKHFGVCLYYDALYIEHKVDEEPNPNCFGIRYLIYEHANAVWELCRGLTMNYTYGADYKEGWLLTLLRFSGLLFPGISAHCPTNYINSVRLGKRVVHMPTF